MRKNNPRYKGWKSKRDRKKAKNKVKRRRLHKEKPRSKTTTVHSEKAVSERFLVPSNFCLSGNAEECLSWFDEICKFHYQGRGKVAFYIDMSKVSKISVDALMYLLSIAQNKKYQEPHMFSFGGSLPQNPSCRKIVLESGFLDFMRSPLFLESFISFNVEKNRRIRTGCQVEADTIGEICDFAKPLIGNTKTLYTVLGEIMSNTKEHAYSLEKETKSSEEQREYKNWMVFVEKTSSKLSILFLDNGQGIAKTVAKKVIEKLTLKQDVSYVKSALNGDFLRSETKEVYRGRGLPRIKQTVTDGYFSKISILTNRAFISISQQKETPIQLKASFRGTMFYLEKKI